MPKQLSRRAFVSATALGAVSLSTWSCSPFEREELKVRLPTRSAEELEGARKGLERLLAPYAIGADVAGSRLAAITIDPHGTGVVELERPDGRRFRVDICLLAGDERALASTQSYGLYLHNGGDGDLPTDEAMGLAVLVLGIAIRANEVGVPPLNLASKREQRVGASKREQRVGA